MTPQQQKIQAQLELRANELDAREKYLNSLEKSYAQLKLDIKVAEETLAAKQRQLDTTMHKHQTLLEKIAKLDTDARHRSSKIKEDTQQAQNIVSVIIDRQNSLKKTVAELKTERDRLKTEADDLKLYIKDQEETLERVTEQGQDVILDMRSEVAGLEDKKQLMSKEIENLEHEKEQIGYSLVVVRQHYTQESKEMEQKRDTMRQSLSDMQKKIESSKLESLSVFADIAEKQRQLHEKEQSLIAKQDALIRERQEFETDKRRWESAKRLYNGL